MIEKSEYIENPYSIVKYPWFEGLVDSSIAVFLGYKSIYFHFL